MKEENQDIAQVLSIFFSIGVFILVSIFISRYYSPSINIDQIKEMFVPNRALAPEPVERAIYLIGLMIFPISLFFSHRFFFQLLNSYSNHKKLKTVHHFLSYFIFFCLSLLFYIDFSLSPSGNLNDPQNFLRNNYFWNYPSKSFLGFGLVILLMFIVQQGNKVINKILLSIFYLLSLILVISLSLATVFVFYDPWASDPHFSAVFYPMVQVYLGKALLVDLVNQYGLYPHFLEPLFKVIGLSVFNFTIVMAILISISFLLILKFLKDIIRNKIIFICGFFTVIFYNYLAFQIFYGGGIFFHLYPIRFYIFPTLMIFLCWQYFNNQKKTLYYLIFLLSPFAFLWNHDSGTVIFFSWILVLLYQECFQVDLKIAIKKIISHIVTGALAIITILFFYWLYIYLRYNNWPTFKLLYEYQKQYLLYGHGNLPMRFLYPWNLVILIYIIGLSTSIKSLISKRNTPKAKMVLWLSLFGLGIFSYYQGRTVDNGLFNVCYPAFLLLAIFVDDLFFDIENIKSDGKALLGGKILLFISLLYLLSSSVFSVFFNHHFISDSIKKRVQFYAAIAPNKVKVPTSIIENVEFVKGHTNKGEEVLILSYNSHIYHLESGTTCPVKIPALIELHLKKDYEKVKDFLTNNMSKSKKVFLDTNPDTTTFLNNPEILEILTKNFKIIDKSKDESILFFKRMI